MCFAKIGLKGWAFFAPSGSVDILLASTDVLFIYCSILFSSGNVGYDLFPSAFDREEAVMLKLRGLAPIFVFVVLTFFSL